MRFLEDLPADAEHALRAAGRVRSYAAGAPLMYPGQVGDVVVVLLEGAVKVVAVGPDGREALLGLRGPGEVIGELAVLDGRPRSGGVYAIADVEALVLRADAFRALLREQPALTERLVLVLAARLRDADAKRGEHARDTAARVASRLAELAERFGAPDGDDIRVELPITQAELAAWAGASVESVARALATLREAGWISTARRTVLVHDAAALAARAES